MKQINNYWIDENNNSWSCNTKKEKNQVIRYCSVITSIIANIIFIIVIINTYFLPVQVENMQKEIQKQNLQEKKQDTLNELFLLLRQTDGWSIHSAAYPDEFPNKCYVRIEINSNDLILDISQKNIIKEIKRVIIAIQDQDQKGENNVRHKKIQALP